MGDVRGTRPVSTLFVIGTRPEAIKVLPVILELVRRRRYDVRIVSTGQHPELVAEVLALGGLKPDFTLPSSGPNRTLSRLFADVMLGLTDVLGSFGPPTPTVHGTPPPGTPASVFVHGDTTSAAAAALAAFHYAVPVVHIEAGLRTSNTLSPFPEELNRQLISRIAALHFAPTFRNKENLTREGIEGGRVFVSGNTAIDALLFASSLDVPYEDPQLADLDDDPRRVVVVTAHRRENWGEPIERIAESIAELAKARPLVRFVVAMHPNPAVQQVIRGKLDHLDNVSVVGPMGYVSFARLLRRSWLVMTDSGGIQEEAPALGKPVILLRETTERQEGVDAGTVLLVGSDSAKILQTTRELLDDPREYARRAALVDPYGDGQAARRIIDACEHVLFDTPEPAQFGGALDRLAVLRAGGYTEDPKDFRDPDTSWDVATGTVEVQDPFIHSSNG
ncbi:non-hydrolyzing UDP-N-acetylglucosamine 2-epimerase [Agromyces seonyuensis]|uniref:UDP-N-acetylglucosamine 2-epimerase (non-hydrolyzing) n=1 Tax=Agromyces seonyuensis TaxID=2662446 RepID=A0A6I4P4I4_9MICO|nr:UDP-N-acetylglucosamine 2-epimerase (non-hydrolyzing) [Agromyces seonyuensis]MWB98327.1 UDP-N-acetylglucosamine 2-epimerase (non-hydrolyzing) [Agromyces seonyuensis]